MQPTMILRFVDRKEESDLDANGAFLPPDIVRVVTRRILQQSWTDGYGRNEWRDVPMAEEEA